MWKYTLLLLNSMNKRIQYFQLKYNKGLLYNVGILIQLDMSMHHCIIHAIFMYLVNSLGTEDTILRPLSNVSK